MLIDILRLIAVGVFLFVGLLVTCLIWWMWYSVKSSWSYYTPRRRKLLIRSLYTLDLRDIEEIERNDSPSG